MVIMLRSLSVRLFTSNWQRCQTSYNEARLLLKAQIGKILPHFFWLRSPLSDLKYENDLKTQKD